MQQPVNNRWLSPALRNLADQGPWTPDRQQALYRAGLEAREAIVLQTRGDRRGRSNPGHLRSRVDKHTRAGAGRDDAGGASAIGTQPTGAGWLRQIVLAVAMAGLLLGSIAFSLLAWSGTLVPSPIGLDAAVSSEDPAPLPRPAGNTTGTQQTPGGRDAKGERAVDMSPGQRVRLLREENGRLHERAAALRSRLR